MKKISFNLFVFFVIFVSALKAQKTDKEYFYMYLRANFEDVFLSNFKPNSLSGTIFYGKDDFSEWMNKSKDEKSNDQYHRAVYLMFQLKGVTKKEQNSLDEIGKEIEKYKQTYPDFFWAKFLYVAYLYKSGLDENNEQFYKLLQEKPQDAYACLFVAIYTKDVSEAIEYTRKAIELDSKFPYAYYWYGNLLDDSSDKKEIAIEQVQKAIDLDNKFMEAYALLAKLYSDQKEYTKAIASYEKAIQIKPKNAELYIGKSIVENNAGNYDKAIESANKVIELESNNYLGYMSLGVAYAGKKNKKDACKNFKKARSLALTYETKEKVEEVEAYMKEICK